MPEQRLETAEHTVNFLDKIGSAEVLADPESRKDFILELSTDDFSNWLVRINGMARGVVPGEREIDGQNVHTALMEPPEAEDKEPLLVATLEAAKSILTNTGDVEEALARTSLLFSGAINYIHPFADGNGRTSRVLGFLTFEGYDGSAESAERLKEVMGKDGGIAFQNNPGLLTSFLDRVTVTRHKPSNAKIWPARVNSDTFAGESLGQEAVAHLSESARHKAAKVVSDPDLGEYAITAYMVEHDLIPKGVDLTKSRYAEVSELEYLSKFEDKDVDGAFEELRSMKKDRVLNFINAMSNPDDYPIHLSSDRDRTRFEDRDTTIYEYYSELVKEYSHLYTEEGPMVRRMRERRAQKAGAIAVREPELV